MPVKFLTSEQVAQYGHYAVSPTSKQLAKYFHLDDAELKTINSLDEGHTKLGFAVQLGTARFLGTFLTDLTEVPFAIIMYTANQLGLHKTEILWQKYIGGRSQRRHREKIRQLYEYEDFGKSNKPFALVRHLYARAWLTPEKPLTLFDYATAWLVQNKVLLPGATVLERLIAQIINRANKRLWQKLIALVDETEATRLLSLLKIDDGARFSHLEIVRRPTIRASALTIKDTMNRLEKIRTISVNNLDLSGFPIGRINAMARYGLTAWATLIDDLGKEHKLATLLVTAHELEALIQDEVLDLLLMIIDAKFKNAKKEGLNARVKLLAELDLAALQCSTACKFVLNNDLPEKKVRATIFQHIPRQELEHAVALINHETISHGPHYYDQLVNSYRSVRLFLPKLLETITFDGTGSSQAVLAAWRFLSQLDHGKPRPNVQDAPTEIIKNAAWRAVVYNNEQLIDRRYYTFCTLQQVSDALRRRDIFVAPSRHWQDQRLQLLHGEAWKKVRPQVCAALGKTTDGAKEVKKLSKQLDKLYRKVAKRFAKNNAVSIKRDGDHERISLSRQGKLRTTSRLKKRRKQVNDLLPEIDLPDLLLEIHRITGFADEFTHVSENESRADDLHLSICAVLLAEACNVGLDDVVNPNIPALRRGRLLWVQQNYIRDETLTRANAKLVYFSH